MHTIINKIAINNAHMHILKNGLYPWNRIVVKSLKFMKSN